MKHKVLVLVGLISVLTASFAVVANSDKLDAYILKGTGDDYSITLDSDSAIEAIDNGCIHQISVKNNKFDIVGWNEQVGKLGSIKRQAYGNYHYNGMIYNRSVINGFNQLTVTFSGGNLYYLFTDFLMENMDFNGQILESGMPVNANGKAYFLVYNPSETAVSIDSLEVTYSCDHSIDNEMIYNRTTSLGGARSFAKRTVLEDSFMTLENNPTANTNNYSTGSHAGHADAWYRWNGRYFTDSADLGTEFTFGMTIMGEYSRMIDENEFFHTNVWPQFSYGNSKDEQWIQTYIGNDNYEPLGSEHALHPSDPYVQESYEGRFFTNYDCYNENWEIDYENGSWRFADPDKVTIKDGSLTLREAYERYNLPFWFVKFHVYLGEDNDAMVDVSINGMVLYTTYVFENYDKVNTPSIHIHTLPCHLVNYGVDAEGTPDESYTGAFTYPRLITE